MSLGGVLPSITTKCPNCSSTHLRRSKWHRGERGWFSFLYSPYRCEACEKRFLKLSYRFEKVLLWSAVIVVLAVAIGAVIYSATVDFVPDTAKPVAIAKSRSLADGPSGSVRTLAPYARAAAGDAQSQYELGMMLLNGEGGVARNPTEALKWLETAAKSGHADARYTLGIMHQKGQGALQNFEQALHWFEAAAAQNHANAQYNAALMYKNGMGVAVDLVKAYMWANVAAVQGNLDAMTVRDNLLNLMSPQQIAEGQRASREWKPVDQKTMAVQVPPLAK
jgi:hypothetical protein